MQQKNSFILGLLFLLAACGGGGGSRNTPSGYGEGGAGGSGIVMIRYKFQQVNYE